MKGFRHVPCMTNEHTLHIVDGCIRSRANLARTCFELGYHCEVYADARELLSFAPSNGIVLVRNDGNGNGAVALLTSFANAGLWLPVVAIAHDPATDDVVAAIKAGALEFIRLPFEAARLQDAIQRIGAEADAYAEARRRVIEARNQLSILSPREREVLDWLAEGRSNKMIARELGISPRTVEIHRANMMTKIGARHSAEAVRLQIEAGMAHSPQSQVA